MAIVIVPELKPIPVDATPEYRQKLYDEYCAELIKLNPQYFNQDGSPKSIWSLIRNKAPGARHK
jgi:hypothetical protein